MDNELPMAAESSAIRLHVSQAASIDMAFAASSLERLDWLGTPVDAEPAAGIRRVMTSLELPIRDRSASGPVRKAAFIDLGRGRRRGDRIDVEIAWRSTSFTPLFPVFAGHLSVTPNGMILEGHYAPPFGPVGMLLDRTLLHLVAVRTANGLLARLAEQFAVRSAEFRSPVD